VNSDAEFLFLYNEAKQTSVNILIENPEFPYEKILSEQSDRPASDGFLPPEHLRILSPKNPDF